MALKMKSGRWVMVDNKHLGILAALPSKVEMVQVSTLTDEQLRAALVEGIEGTIAQTVAQQQTKPTAEKAAQLEAAAKSAQGALAHAKSLSAAALVEVRKATPMAAFRIPADRVLVAYADAEKGENLARIVRPDVISHHDLVAFDRVRDATKAEIPKSRLGLHHEADWNP